MQIGAATEASAEPTDDRARRVHPLRRLDDPIARLVGGALTRLLGLDQRLPVTSPVRQPAQLHDGRAAARPRADRRTSSKLHDSKPLPRGREGGDTQSVVECIRLSIEGDGYRCIGRLAKKSARPSTSASHGNFNERDEWFAREAMPRDRAERLLSPDEHRHERGLRRISPQLDLAGRGAPRPGRNSPTNLKRANGLSVRDSTRSNWPDDRRLRDSTPERVESHRRTARTHKIPDARPRDRHPRGPGRHDLRGHNGKLRGQLVPPPSTRGCASSKAPRTTLCGMS